MQARTHSCIRTMPIMTSLANTTFSRFNHTLAVKTRFTKDHEWLVVDNHGVATIGITDYAQKALGDVVFVEVPIIGDTVKKNDHIGAIESVKAASDIYTPVSGDIFLVNEKLTAEPSLINKSAEVEGWFVQIKMSNIEETDSKDLMDEDAYAAYCEKADKDNDA
ncbi:glycine cleavage system H protein [Lichtheimia ornata]|uniref:Glycine cleavage system H protein n=1 Tax=Lichtheimia ornata TaxID=688661 RepID=A0AAD7UZW5_9FUNG|nr:glycine cleavage system H protein [Lichtheimia ornata]KAJ8655181.1 glycine cleavage system H protein [Lichtheimia ornata]